MINTTNDYYLSHGLAGIHRNRLPSNRTCHYPHRKSRAKIVEAYFRQASTTDYSGVYDGYHIDFEAGNQAKACDTDEIFILHQIQHMGQVLAQQEICFVLMLFFSAEATAPLLAIDLIRFYHQDKDEVNATWIYSRKWI